MSHLMMKYTMNEGSFEVPDGWRDQSVNIFVVGSAPPLPLSFVISRDSLRVDEQLVDRVEMQLGMLAEKMRHFRLLGKRQVQVGGRLALEAEFTWQADNGPMHQRQQYVRHGNKMLTFTATSPVKIADEHIEDVENLLKSVRLCDDD